MLRIVTMALSMSYDKDIPLIFLIVNAVLYRVLHLLSLMQRSQRARDCLVLKYTLLASVKVEGDSSKTH